MSEFLRGTGVALVTPFNADGSIDYDGLKKLLNYQIESGVDYLVALGTTGETATISDEERFAILDFVAEHTARKIPIVAGFGGNDTQHVIDSLKKYAGLNQYDAILSVSPYYNKPNQTGILNHYSAIAEDCPLPIILYNVPSRTGSNINAETCIQLAEAFENIVAIKEASGDLNQIMQIIHQRPEGFLLISGDDILTMPMMALGIDGLISVIGNALPFETSNMVRWALEGDFKSAGKMHFDLLDLMHLIFEEGNPVGVKSLLRELSICEKFVRLPLAISSEELDTKIARALGELKKELAPS